MSKILSVCMIIRDSEEILKKTLPNLVRCADEVIVVDTGSLDNTVKVAQGLGARVFHFKWANDFALARNESIKHAEGDWILWIDADEYVKEEDILKLKEILSLSEEDAYNLPLYECKEGELKGDMFYFRVKVFRNRKGYHFRRAINEQVCDAQGRYITGKILSSNISIYHWGGRLDPEKMRRKKERNIEMLKAVIAGNEGDPYYHFLLANNYKDIGQYELAIGEYDRVIQIMPQGELTSHSYTKKAWCFYHLKKMDEASKNARKAIELNPFDAGAYNILGIAHAVARRLEEAVKIFEHSKNLKMPVHAGSMVSLKQYKYFPHYLLGNTYALMGEKEKAIRHFKKAYEFEPDEEVRKKIEILENASLLQGGKIDGR